MNYGEAQTGKLTLDETPNRKVSYGNVPQTRPRGWPPADPGPPPQGMRPVLSLLPEQVLDWAGLRETARSGLAVPVQQSLSLGGWKSPLEFQMTCGCRRGEAAWPGSVQDTSHSWSDLRGVRGFYWQRFIAMSFCWVGGRKLSETCRNELWAQALEKIPFQQSFHLPLLSLSSRRRLWSSL